MTKRNFYAIWLAIVILGGVAISSLAYMSSLNKDRLNERGIMEQNRKFVEGFFNFESTDQRYDAIKPYTTEQGYRATFPSGTDLPQNSKIHSKVNNLKAFIQKDPVPKKEEVEILNKFELTTEFNGIGSTQTIIMKTILLETDNWKVNDIEMIIQNTHE
ncbi:hypothetical protein [Paenibacillus illinoisensis]|uniref:hypothetical protein n=1 Tax=Paenibacillus illinoisensis TaxID=59845 RepID=UPI003D97183D